MDCGVFLEASVPTDDVTIVLNELVPNEYHGKGCKHTERGGTVISFVRGFGEGPCSGFDFSFELAKVAAWRLPCDLAEHGRK